MLPEEEYMPKQPRTRDTDNPYFSKSQQALLQVLVILGERPLDIMTLAALTEQSDLPRDQVFRALQNLQIGGWAEQAPGGAWRLTPLVVRIAERMRLAIHNLCQAYLGEN